MTSFWIIGGGFYMPGRPPFRNRNAIYTLKGHKLRFFNGPEHQEAALLRLKVNYYEPFHIALDAHCSPTKNAICNLPRYILGDKNIGKN